MKAAFFTFGCKVNQYETQSLMAAFQAAGFEIADGREDCEAYVVNSCTVTSEGDSKVRKLLRRLRREHPYAVLALTGCYAQAFPGIEKLVPQADVITGTSNRAALLPAVQRALATRQRLIDLSPYSPGEPFEPMRLSSFRGRTRAFLKIQDGCEQFCAYCIIPTARGPFRSKKLEDLSRELAQLAKGGFQEVVLAGINLSAYGVDFGGRLLDAVTIAANTPGIARVRLSSLEPELLTPDDISSLAKLPQFCPHFHLSLQSGCDATLRRMNRHYDTAQYREIAGRIRGSFENPAITTDIMVGFPGEDEAEFSESLAFAEETGFAKMHVFPYSRRPGTAADAMGNQIPQETKAARAKQMLALAAKTRAAFLQAQCGARCRVLAERQIKPGVYHGYSENYTPVTLTGGSGLVGKIVPVRITNALFDECQGEADG